MGVGILIVAVLAELAIAAFCIGTKRNQTRIRSVLRIAEFFVFLILACISLIRWSFRYYAFAAVLLLLAVVGIVSLLRKRQEAAYGAIRVAGKAIAMALLLFIAILPAIVFVQNYPVIPATGPNKVATSVYTYTDTSRAETYAKGNENRKLTFELWYPQDGGGTYPLIVFSHGSLGVKTSNETLYRELASHGYVVCAIDHTYQCFFTTDTSGHTTLINLGFMNELSTELRGTDKQFSYRCYQKWMDIRMGDINFVIDRILANAKDKDADAAFRLVDTKKIGVIGHSLGGSAALGIGRARADVGAVIALEAPLLYDIKGVEGDEFIFTKEAYPVPLLNVYSDDSWNNLGKWPQYRENYLLTENGSGAFNVHIGGAGHLDLTDLSLISPLLTRMLNGHKSQIDAQYCLTTINKVCLAFFDCYLKGKGNFTMAGTY